MNDSPQFGRPSGKPDVRGVMMPASRVRMTARGASETVAEFRQWAEAVPEMMRTMPLVLDAAHHTACASLMEVARDFGLIVIGVAEGKLAPTAAAAGLPVLPEDALMPARAARPAAADRPPATKTAAEAPAAEAGPAEAAPAASAGGGAETPAAASGAGGPAARATRVVHTPVRSGQQVYAEGADLVVLGTVSAGAEVIADGHVHVYGALRGRAIAGARGDDAARIFCQRFEPELIALAGTYDVAEKLHQDFVGKAVQVWLEDGSLQFGLLG